MYEVKIAKFEGPLDLLLELIEDEKLDITEIALAEVTSRYLSEIAKLDPKAYDVAEFLVVASKLIYLKSRAILPTIATEEEEAEIEDLKAKLEIYKKYKDAAKQFGNILEEHKRSYPAKKPQFVLSKFTPPKGVELRDLWSTFQKLLSDMPEELKREEVEIPSEKITVEEKIADLENLIKTKSKHRFSSIIKTSKSRLEAIITFLAVLEMVKLKKIKVAQSASFKDIELMRIK